MGKGDKKTRRGKIIIGSYGVRRNHKKKKERKKLHAPVKLITKPDKKIITKREFTIENENEVSVLEPIVEVTEQKFEVQEVSPKQEVKKNEVKTKTKKTTVEKEIVSEVTVIKEKQAKPRTTIKKATKEKKLTKKKTK